MEMILSVESLCALIESTDYILQINYCNSLFFWFGKFGRRVVEKNKKQNIEKLMMSRANYNIITNKIDFKSFRSFFKSIFLFNVNK